MSSIAMKHLSRGTSGVAVLVIGIASAAIWPAGAANVVQPDFSSNNNVGWIAASTEFIPPASSVWPEDPGAFTKPWDAVQRYRRVEPGKAENNVPLTELSSSAAGPLIEISCAENPGAYFGKESVAIPQAARFDF